jgi:hypothetical protein
MRRTKKYASRRTSRMKPEMPLSCARSSRLVLEKIRRKDLWLVGSGNAECGYPHPFCIAMRPISTPRRIRQSFEMAHMKKICNWHARRKNARHPFEHDRYPEQWRHSPVDSLHQHGRFRGEELGGAISAHPAVGEPRHARRRNCTRS